MSINLAPHNKTGLLLDSPLVAAHGAAGYGDAWPPALKPDDFGLIITAAVSAGPRQGKAGARLAEIPAGFMLETGEHNPGFRRLLKSHIKRWRKMRTPIALSLVGGEPGDRAWMAARLEDLVDVIAAIELPLSEDANLSETAAMISAVRRVTALPILVRPPLTRAAYLARTCIVAGADALIVGTPPLAAYQAANAWVEAPVSGPAALPFTLRALRQLAAMKLDVPIVAQGGIHTLNDALLCLELGASAVGIRSLVWRDPAAAHRLALNIRPFMADGDA